MHFKDFVLSEANNYLAQKVGDVLSALQSLSSDASNLGNRQLIRAAQGIVKQIRRILHDSWPDEEQATLRLLQKIGVALMRGIDSNEDMRQILATAVQSLEKGSGDKPLNDLGSPETP